MFRSWTIIREPELNLAKVIFMLKDSVKLRRYLLCGCVAACHGKACGLYAAQNTTLSFEILMSLCTRLFSETLRKYPPVQSLMRICTKPYRIPGTDVDLEKDIQIFIPVMGLHYDPKYYPEPERFDPERFSDKEKKNRPQYSYLPFGEGPRICIGE